MSEIVVGAPRRKPTQQRSRERVDAILGATESLIARSGSDHLKMSEVAATSGISIGSLYQYFPDKASLIRSLAERNQAESRACIAEALAKATDDRSLQVAFDELVDLCYGLLKAEPVRRDVAFGMQADKDLAALEIEESRVCGTMLADAIARFHPQVARDRLDPAAFLVWQLGESAFRLAVTVGGEEGDRLIATYKRMSWRELAALWE